MKLIVETHKIIVDSEGMSMSYKMTFEIQIRSDLKVNREKESVAISYTDFNGESRIVTFNTPWISKDEVTEMINKINFFKEKSYTNNL